MSSLPENSKIFALMQSPNTVASMGEVQSGEMPGLPQHENVAISAVPLVTPERHENQFARLVMEEFFTAQKAAHI